MISQSVQLQRQIGVVQRTMARAETELALAKTQLGFLLDLLSEDYSEQLMAEPIAVPDVTPVIPPVPEPVIGELVLNDEWKAVLSAMNSGTDHIFVTGDAGTGKSTLLNHFVDNASLSIAIVAPTGVAALRVGGETIHRFFSFGIGAIEKDDINVLSDSRRRKFKALDVLVIDEISMVRADLMDAIDQFLRKNGRVPGVPFGGCRIIMFGDLFQLPPVSKEKDEKKWLTDRYGTDTPYFFHADCWRDAPPKTFTLTTIFRQKDQVFTDALNAIRRGETTPEHLSLINSRVKPYFKDPENEMWITLTTTSASADESNQKMLAALTTEPRIFEALVSGDFDLKNAPTDERLELKAGAAVMFIRNHKRGVFVNGTIGKVTSVNPLKVAVNGAEIEVEREEWESIVYEFNEETKKLSRMVKGTFAQVPLKLAAAITIHKAQGLTFDRCIIDFAYGAFAAGQAYVALSRCRTLEGMILRKGVQVRDLITSTEVQLFSSGKPIARPNRNSLNALPLFAEAIK